YAVSDEDWLRAGARRVHADRRQRGAGSVQGLIRGHGMRSWLRWFVLAIIILCIGGFYLFGLQDHFSWDGVRAPVDDLKAWTSENFLLAVAIFFALYAIMTALSVPAAWVLTLVAGAIFGRFFGAGVALLAATVGATLAFLSARFLFGNWVQNRFADRLENFNRGFEKDGAFYLFSLRLVPFVPFFLINLGMGLTPIRTWTYFWVSL